LANGAFPDSETVLTPADRPQEIVLVTNFGLITSADGGTTWLWSCEQDGNMLGMLYQLTPLPRNRLFAIANQKLAFSDDRSCGWQTASGAVDGQFLTDVFLDPVSGTRLIAIGVVNQMYSLFQSTDAGATFGPALYQAAARQTMTSVEIARSDPNVVYLALRASDTGAPVPSSAYGRTPTSTAAMATYMTVTRPREIMMLRGMLLRGSCASSADVAIRSNPM